MFNIPDPTRHLQAVPSIHFFNQFPERFPRLWKLAPHHGSDSVVKDGPIIFQGSLVIWNELLELVLGLPMPPLEQVPLKFFACRRRGMVSVPYRHFLFGQTPIILFVKITGEPKHRLKDVVHRVTTNLIVIVAKLNP